ncbi:MAG: hypothetical protein JST35_12215 [Armatimonadetes bacterium]|nr:hypothetical protein [Armatimonadota bacterium]
MIYGKTWIVYCLSDPIQLLSDEGEDLDCVSISPDVEGSVGKVPMPKGNRKPSLIRKTGAKYYSTDFVITLDDLRLSDEELVEKIISHLEAIKQERARVDEKRNYAIPVGAFLERMDRAMAKYRELALGPLSDTFLKSDMYRWSQHHANARIDQSLYDLSPTPFSGTDEGE